MNCSHSIVCLLVCALGLGLGGCDDAPADPVDGLLDTDEGFDASVRLDTGPADAGQDEADAAGDGGVMPVDAIGGPARDGFTAGDAMMADGGEMMADGSMGDDAGPDGGRVDGAPADGALDSGADHDAASPDGAVTPDGGPTDGGMGLDGRVVDAIVDAEVDAIVDAEIDMPWLPAQHRVFFTAEAFSADLGGLAGADALCQTAAREAGLGGAWAAIISDGDTAARDRLVVRGPIETVNGERVAQSAEDLWDGTIRVPIGVDARGERVAGQPNAWTGTDADGASDRRGNTFCNRWGLDGRPLGGVEIGRGDQTDARWISLYRDGASAFACTSTAHLFCIDGQ